MAYMFMPFRLDVSRFGLDKFFGDAYGSSSGNQMAAQITLNFNPGTNIFMGVQSNATTLGGGMYKIRLYTESQTEASCEHGLYRNVA